MAYSVEQDLEYRMSATTMTTLASPETTADVSAAVIGDADAEMDLFGVSSWTTAQRKACSVALAVERFFQRGGNSTAVPLSVSDEADKWRAVLKIFNDRTREDDLRFDLAGEARRDRVVIASEDEAKRADLFAEDEAKRVRLAQEAADLRYRLYAEGINERAQKAAEEASSRAAKAVEDRLLRVEKMIEDSQQRAWKANEDRLSRIEQAEDDRKKREELALEAIDVKRFDLYTARETRYDLASEDTVKRAALAAEKAALDASHTWVGIAYNPRLDETDAELSRLLEGDL